MRKCVSLFLVLAVFLCAPLVWAGGDEPTMKELMKEVRALKARVAELESKLSKQDKTIDRVKELEAKVSKSDTSIKELRERVVPLEYDGRHVDHKRKVSEFLKVGGLRIGAHITGIVQGTPNANNAGSDEDSRFDGSWTADIDMVNEFGDWGKAFLELEAGQGDTLNGEMALFSLVNDDANDTGADVIVNEFWYEQYLFDKQFTITGGKLDPTDYFDDNEYANNATFQFLGGLFNNSPAVEWPSDNAFGFTGDIHLKSVDFLDLRMGYFEGDADWEDVLENGVYFGQVNLMPASLFGADPEQYGGNYRFYGWANTRFHSKLVAANQQPSEDTKEINYGFGLSCDQKVTDVFGLFGRFGWQRPDLIPADGGPTIEWLWSVGAHVSGKRWNRENDVIAVAVGQLFPSDKYEDAVNASGAEGHLEAYYRWQLNKYLGISPDFQIIWNPNGGATPRGGNDAIFVYGARAHLDF